MADTLAMVPARARRRGAQLGRGPRSSIGQLARSRMLLRDCASQVDRGRLLFVLAPGAARSGFRCPYSPGPPATALSRCHVSDRADEDAGAIAFASRRLDGSPLLRRRGGRAGLTGSVLRLTIAFDGMRSPGPLSAGDRIGDKAVVRIGPDLRCGARSLVEAATQTGSSA
jgi:hypothetical protein